VDVSQQNDHTKPACLPVEITTGFIGPERVVRIILVIVANIQMMTMMIEALPYPIE
jgi:hypothetical protein